jgi:glycerate kinase
MRILVAPSSFRRSLSAPEAAEAIADGLRAGDPTLEIVTLPIADGGDDTGEVLRIALGGSKRTAPVHDALGRPCEASFVVLPDGTAVVDVASASGWGPLAGVARDPLRATTFGTGELIAAALATGARKIVVGVGGSATVDGGAGLLQALGVRWLDARGAPLPPGGAALRQLARVDPAHLDPRLAATEIVLACDVDSPLLGPAGAARVFGPQKGAGPDAIEVLEAGLACLAEVVARDLSVDLRSVLRAGAAGGVAGSLHAVLNAPLRAGADLVLRLVGFEDRLGACDLVVAAEGQLDAQTLGGKGPFRVASAASRRSKPVIMIVGGIDPDLPREARAMFDAVFSVCRRPMTVEQAMAQGATLLRDTATEVARVLALGRRAQMGVSGAIPRARTDA